MYTSNYDGSSNLFRLLTYASSAGIPTYMAPSLRRSTIERTALSKKLAEEAAVTSTKKSSLRVPGGRTTETSASLKDKIGSYHEAVQFTTIAYKYSY